MSGTSGIDLLSRLEPAPEAPTWAKLLMSIGKQMRTAEVPVSCAPRAIVAAPTTRHVASTLAISALNGKEYEPEAVNLVNRRVATVLSKKLEDAQVSLINGRVSLRGISFPQDRRLPPMFEIPEDFSIERSGQLVPATSVDLGKQLIDGQAGEWTYVQLCREPVVVVTTRPQAILQDMADLSVMSTWWTVPQKIALLEVKDGLDWWFRRPVIVATPAAIASSSWCRKLPVSALVILGFNAWISGVRMAWPTAPHALVLGQRSADVSEFRNWFDGTNFPSMSLAGIRQHKKFGITTTLFAEPVRAAMEASDPLEDDSWEF